VADHRKREVTKLLFEEFENTVKGKWGFEPDPIKAAKLMIEHIDKKRKLWALTKPESVSSSIWPNAVNWMRPDGY